MRDPLHEQFALHSGLLKTQSLLARAATELNTCLDLSVLTRKATRIALPDLADWAILDIVRPSGEVSRLATACARPVEAANLEAVKASTLTAEAYSELREVDRPRIIISGTLRREMIERFLPLPMYSLIAAPIHSISGILGWLFLIRTDSTGSGMESDLSHVQSYADLIAPGVSACFELEAARQDILDREFMLTAAAHDLRNPLTALHLSADMLKMSMTGAICPNPEKQVLQVDLIQRAARSLSDSIGALFSFSEIRSGKLTLNLSRCDLTASIRDLLERLEPLLSARATPLHLRPAPDPIVGNWDWPRLERVLTNLIANSLKHAAGAPIEITIERTTTGNAKVTVRDEGPGIPESHQGRIFGSYQRVESGTSREGLGLGLYIVKNIVEAHGGSISVQSILGQGACFNFEIPGVLDA